MIRIKVIIILILFSIKINCFAQLPKDDSGEVIFTEVVQVEGYSQKKIYDKAKLWVVSTLKSGDNMVELGSDESTSRMVGTGNIQLKDIPIGWYGSTKETYLNFKFIILCKENRYKYEVSNFTFKYAYLSDQPYTVSTRLEEIELPHYMDKKKFANVATTFKANANDQILKNINFLIQDLKKTIAKEEKEW